MYHVKIYENGNLFSKIFTFPKRGQGIPMHMHYPDSYHNTIVLKGSVEIYGPNKSWSQVAMAGQVIDFPSEQYQTHEIAALEDDTILMNNYLYGKHKVPEGYQCVEGPKEGWVDGIPLTIPLDAIDYADYDPVIV